MLRQTLESFASYDPETGHLICTSNRRGSRKWPGEKLGTVNTLGYRVLMIDRKLYYIHHLTWLLHYHTWPVYEIDHIDGDKDNNRIENLRDVPRWLNTRNMKKGRKNTSGYLGVQLRTDGKKWVTRVHHGKFYVDLGSFSTPEEAAQARQEYLDARPELGYTEKHGSEQKFKRSFVKGASR